MLYRISAQIASKMASFWPKTLFKVDKMLLLSSNYRVESGMSREWRHQKSCSFLIVDLRNSNWSFSESFSTYKITENTQIDFPWDEIWPWNTENFDEIAQLQFAIWYTVIDSVLISVCTFCNGVRGQNVKVKVSISKHGKLEVKIFILHWR